MGASGGGSPGLPGARNLLQTVPKAHQEMVAAALRSVFAQQSKEAVLEQWDQVSAMLAAKFPRAAELMAKACEDVLAFRHFPSQHWKKVWSINLFERVNEDIKRRTRVVGIFPNDTAITRLVGAVLLEQDENWQLEGRRSAPKGRSGVAQRPRAEADWSSCLLYTSPSPRD